MTSPSQQVLMVECQTSNQDSSPYSHSSNLSFSYPTFPRENEMGEPPQPRQREKSLPVPMGMMQNETLVRSIPASPTKEVTHRTVPSPPHTTATTFPFPLLSTFACTRRIFSSAASLPCVSKRSIRCMVMVVSLPNWQVSFRLGMVRYWVPTPPPDLELMKRKKEMRSWSPCGLSIWIIVIIDDYYNRDNDQQRSASLEPRYGAVAQRKRLRRVVELTLPQLAQLRPLQTSVSNLKVKGMVQFGLVLVLLGLKLMSFPLKSVVNEAWFSLLFLNYARYGLSSSLNARMASYSFTFLFLNWVIFYQQGQFLSSYSVALVRGMSRLASGILRRLWMIFLLGMRYTLTRERWERQTDCFLFQSVGGGRGRAYSSLKRWDLGCNRRESGGWCI